MKARKLAEWIHWVGAIDWDRRLFDALVPLPEGTTYNAYLVQGSDKTALIDTVDPAFADTLFARLDSLGVERIDYVVSNHAEQDHSGSLSRVLERFPEAKVVCTPRAKKMLMDLMPIPDQAFQEVEDGATLALGNATLQFVHFPWVHWPETMLTYVPEAKVLFPCDLFGSHLATSDLVCGDKERLLAAAKLYFAQIMMPFAKQIRKNLPKVNGLEIDLIAPSHGPVIDHPAAILAAYDQWVGEEVRNEVVVPFVSMHESTRIMVDHLIDALSDRGVVVKRFDLVSADVGQLAVALVDAATIVFGTPTFLMTAHPNVTYAALLANLLKPKARLVGVIGSYGWGGKSADHIVATLGNLKDVEILEPVLARGVPNTEVLAALDRLAQTIADKHASFGAT
ncbi:FprA family A-type flavoprotein [Myxococcota bacterium]